MSYDLYFYKKENNPIDKKKISSYIEQLDNISIKTDGEQWVYENEDTGVYCFFAFFNPEEDEDYQGYINTGFTFTINFIRPKFFGLESFPILEKMINALNLLILNPQGTDELHEIIEGELLEDWSQINNSFANRNFQSMGLHYLSEEKSNYSWKYSMSRKELQLELGINYFVPKIFYLKKTNSHLVKTMCVWPENIPFILPKVDLILIQKKIKKLFRTKEETGIINYENLLQQFNPYFEDWKGHKKLTINNAVTSKKVFDKLILEHSIEDYGEEISRHNFVNVQGS